MNEMGAKILLNLGETAINNAGMRKFLISTVEKKLYTDLIKANPDNRLIQVQEDKYAMAKALLRSIQKAFEKGHISRKVARGLIDVFLGNVFFGGFYKRRKFISKFGFKPPMFMTISPGKACNLRCIGCYAAADRSTNHLPYDIFDRIILDAKKLWGANFFVISGGEPLMYKDGDKTLLDIVKKHSDCFFLMYTNGTLVNKKIAKRLRELGNITPALSVEGFEKETDERRGKGVFKKVMNAMENLRNEGVPFGLSLTVTKNNADLIMEDDFVDFYYEKQGAIYGWVFHYMPIGREYTLKLLPTPEQRVKLLKKEWKIVRERQVFLADFWNSGTSSDGCISAGRGGGYFYIDWDGNISPCVFAPYSVDNILDVYKNGGSLADVIQSEFFKKIRKWQAEYGYEKKAMEVKNLLRQCPVRDHYAEFYKIVKEVGAKPINEEARAALSDKEYRKGLIKYGEDIEELTKDIWENEYRKKG
jgi:MoaA/NifB/PqqE/SkfB family radical SAM enzyme